MPGDKEFVTSSQAVARSASGGFVATERKPSPACVMLPVRAQNGGSVTCVGLEWQYAARILDVAVCSETLAASANGSSRKKTMSVESALRQAAKDGSSIG